MNTIKLKQGCKSELGIKLHQHFLGKISGVVGRDFEDLICDYFDGNYTQTNIQDRVESAFCDVRKDDTYISVKYSQAVKDKTLSTVTGDNFRTTTIAKMISQSVLMSEGKYTYELGQLNSREELEEFMKDKTITSNKFGIIAGYCYDSDTTDEIVLKVMTSNILSGQQLYNKLLQVYDEFGDMKKELRSHTITKVFGESDTSYFNLPIGDTDITLMKKEFNKINNNIYKDKKSYLNKIQEFVNEKMLEV